MLKYDELQAMIRRQTDPQRILLVFAQREQRQGDEAAGDSSEFSVKPVMYVDKAPEEIEVYRPGGRCQQNRQTVGYGFYLWHQGPQW